MTARSTKLFDVKREVNEGDEILSTLSWHFFVAVGVKTVAVDKLFHPCNY
jgi:hypothetical protein